MQYPRFHGYFMVFCPFSSRAENREKVIQGFSAMAWQEQQKAIFES